MIANLHSILSGKWYINEKYAEANLPLLLGMLTGTTKIEKSKPHQILTVIKSDIFDDEESQEEELDETDGQVAIISIKTPIYKHDQECGPRGTKTISEILTGLEKDKSISGVIFDIDSGGGQAYGTPLLHDQISNFSKPTVTYTDGMMCSAAYYLGSASDHIVANKRAEDIGSIGAYAQILDLSGHYEKLGAKIHTVYATKSTDKNKAYRELLKGNYKPYQTEELDPLVNDFIQDMKTARPHIKKEVFAGATYNGEEALEMGLVDSNGTLQDAIDKVYSLAKETEKSATKTETMSKPNSYPNLEAALGLENPLAVTDNGSYLNEAQKTALENQLTAQATSLKTATDEKTTAETALADAEASHKTALEASENSTVVATASLRAAATLAGVEDLAEEATAEEISTALTAKIEELNGKPGATHTSGGAEGKKEGDHEYIDFESSIYKTN